MNRFGPQIIEIRNRRVKLSLAHTIEDKVEAACARSDLLEKGVG
jgi:hypothetical protein